MSLNTNLHFSSVEKALEQHEDVITVVFAAVGW